MIKGNPLVSIIVPVYGVEAYLDQCINSIVEQTYQNIELILIDDGSSDRCPEICDAWATRDCRIPVSYTHLDVYKRQIWMFSFHSTCAINSF